MLEKLKIVQRVLAALRLTEEGKIENFFMKQRKFLEKNIKNLNKNLETITDKYQEFISEKEEQLEDAKERLQEAYDSVKAEDVVTHEATNNFAERYWKNIGAAEKNIERINAEFSQIKEAFQKESEEIKDQISRYQARLENLS